MPAPDVFTAKSDEIADLKERVRTIRAQAGRRFEGGATGLQVVSYISETMDEFLRLLMDRAIADWNLPDRIATAEKGAVVAVGGTGRGEMFPYSDVDLLFIDAGHSDGRFRDAASRMTQLCWDAGLDLGHSVRTLTECISLAKQDGQIATTLVEARPLWGNEELCNKLRNQFRGSIIAPRLRTFIDTCIASREEDLGDRKPTALELQPDVKKSVGGLRDLHLIRWVTFAIYGDGSLDTLRLNTALPAEDVRRLKAAHEHLTRIRLRLHFYRGSEQDVLTRDEQLRISAELGYQGDAARRPVEEFMQEYFEHSSAIAEIRRRFVALQRRTPVSRRVIDRLTSHRSDDVFIVRTNEIDVRPRHLSRVTGSVESMLRLYKSAAMYEKLPSPQVLEAIKAHVPETPEPLTEVEAEYFRDILGSPRMLGPILRAMMDCRLLDYIIPDVTHIRSLLQFNQYHSYTVDEHTLQAMEMITSYEDVDGPVGAAYRAVQNKAALHLAMFLHDIGKGFPEDHSAVGERIANRIAARLYMSSDDREQVMLLVRKHLLMPDLALRRDISDPKLLLDFSHEVGSPDTLRMLYVLTMADVTSVGPGVMTDWKADLMADLYDRTLLLLSGKRYDYLEERRLAEVKSHVAGTLVPLDRTLDVDAWQQWIDRRLSEFSAYYLTCTPPHRIAADLDIIQQLKPDEIRISGIPDAEKGTVDYRVITMDRPESGLFHKMTGILTMQRMEILSADINTTHAGFVVDSFRVIDRDYSGEVPQHRIDEILAAMLQRLDSVETVEPTFTSNRRFRAGPSGPVADLPLKVVIDNDSSDSRTIIDIFVHDCPGLLYIISRTLFELKVTVDLAKIGTHFDQVVDVFYVTEIGGWKITNADRLHDIRHTLQTRLEDFTRKMSQ